MVKRVYCHLFVVLVVSIASLLIPGIPAVGAVIKAANAVDNVVDAAKAIDNVVDTVNAVDNVTDAAKTIDKAAEGVTALDKLADGVNQAKSGTYAVYQYAEDGVTKYIGMTKKFERRAGEWNRAMGWRIEPIMEGLDKSTARAVEQALIEKYGLEKFGGTLVNQIALLQTSDKPDRVGV